MATQITVTATITDPSGNPLQGNAFVRFRLRNFQGYVPQVSGSAIIDEIQVDSLPNVSGQISQQLWPNNAITPGSTFYTVEFYNQGRLVSSGNYIFNGNTNLNTAAQINTPPVPPGFQLVLQHNGALNSSQSTLNLENTDGSVTITDVGGGTLNLTVPQASFGVVGEGYFAGPGITDLGVICGATTAVPPNDLAANALSCMGFMLTATWTISQVLYQFSTAAGSANTVNFGIYNAAGNKVVDSGTFNSNSLTLQTNTISPAVTLQPGFYWFAVSSTVSSEGSARGPGVQVLGTITQLLGMLNNGANPNVVSAANSTVGGVMPATLGALTPQTTGNFVGFPTPVWRV